MIGDSGVERWHLHRITRIAFHRKSSPVIERLDRLCGACELW